MSIRYCSEADRDVVRKLWQICFSENSENQAFDDWFFGTIWKPENTLLFCAMAAEEWGVADSNFDWSAGAYEEVFTVHPEWAGQVIADLNWLACMVV